MKRQLARQLTLVVAAVALLGQPTAANAATRHTVIADVDQGGGIHLANRPGGFYMGRLYVNQSFDRNEAWYYSSENRSNYAWGHAHGSVGHCFWIGPTRSLYDWTASRWASPSQYTLNDNCTQSQKSFLQGNSGGNIGSDFNCPANSPATFGTATQIINADAGFYHNLEWYDDYRGGPARNQRTILPIGTQVWYRYTTLDGSKAVVYVPGHGWGFVLAAKVWRELWRGYWSYPGEAPWARTCW